MFRASLSILRGGSRWREEARHVGNPVGRRKETCAQSESAHEPSRVLLTAEKAQHDSKGGSRTGKRSIQKGKTTTLGPATDSGKVFAKDDGPYR